MQSPPYCRVPIHNRRGETVAEALVDPEDFDRVSAFRWRLSCGYAVRSTVGGLTNTSMHRFVLGLNRGDSGVVDHINRVKLDNRRANLRIVTHAQNTQNVNAYQGSKSRFRGVYLDDTRKTPRWRAQARVDGVIYRLGSFRTEYEAACAAELFRTFRMPLAEPDPALAEYRGGG